MAFTSPLSQVAFAYGVRPPETAAELDALALLADSEDPEGLRAGYDRGSSWLAKQLGGAVER